MTWTVVNGDNMDVLRSYPDNTFDSVVTDPPYGIAFLGKDWDSRKASETTSKIAGLHNLPSGMAHTSLADDLEFQYWMRDIFSECLRVLKPGGHLLAFSAARTYHHMAMAAQTAGFEVRDQIMWIYSSGFPKSQDIGRQLHKALHGRPDKQRFDPAIMIPVIGDQYRHPESGVIYRKLPDINGDRLAQSHEGTAYGSVFEQVIEVDNDWSGWGTALKPAHEPIVMARKPIDQRNIRENCLHWGVGAINIAATRIPGSESDRFPANVIGEIPEYQKYFYCPKVSKTERGSGNNHPTVKPMELMKYLIRLVTPAGGHVLDPFNGSGSTGCAAVELGYDYTGIELDKDYVDIATKRITARESQCRSGTTFEALFE